MEKPEANDDLANQIEILRARYIASLPVRMRKIEACWRQLDQASMDSKVAQELLYTVHQLTGSAGTFGLEELSRSAEAVESLLKLALADPVHDSSWDRHRIAAGQLVDRLTEELDLHRP